MHQNSPTNKKRQISLSILYSLSIISILLDSLSYEELHSSDLVLSQPVFSKSLSIPFHTRLKASLSSFSLFGCSFFILRSTSSHNCSIGFMSGEKEDHSRHSMCSRFNQFVTVVARCFGSLSCWNIQSLSMFEFFTDCNKSFCRISQYNSPDIFPSIKSRLTTPDAKKHPQHFTLSLPCFTVGIIHCGPISSLVFRQTITFPSKSNKLNLLSSDQTTWLQNPRSFSPYVRAYSSRFPRFTLLTSSFLPATRSNKPTS